MDSAVACPRGKEGFLIMIIEALFCRIERKSLCVCLQSVSILTGSLVGRTGIAQKEVSSAEFIRASSLPLPSLEVRISE